MAIKKYHLFFSLAIIIIALDQITKFLVRKISLNESIPVIKNIFHITRVHNKGIGFGLLQNFNLNWFFILFAIIVILVILYYLKKMPNKALALTASSLIFAGAIGNITDRIFFGFVIDFIDFRIWPAFNIADSAVTIGAILLIFYFYKK